MKRAQLLKIKAQVSSIWAKGCVCWMIVCVLSDLTCLPLLGGGKKSWFIIIIIVTYYCGCLFVTIVIILYILLLSWLFVYDW